LGAVCRAPTLQEGKALSQGSLGGERFALELVDCRIAEHDEHVVRVLSDLGFEDAA
jgi:hypothetical protein